MGKTWCGPSFASQDRTSLLQRAHGRFENVLIGSDGGLQISLFDYVYQMGKSTITQTMAAFSRDLQLPSFALQPEGVLDRIGAALVHNDIDFDSHPEFSRRYLLCSPDEANTRKLFTPSLLTYMEQIPPEKKWHIEASGMTLMVYRGWPIKPSDLPAFLDEASSIARIFLSSQPKSGPTLAARTHWSLYG